MNNKHCEEDFDNLWTRYTNDLSSVGYNNLKLFITQRESEIRKKTILAMIGSEAEAIWQGKYQIYKEIKDKAKEKFNIDL